MSGLKIAILYCLIVVLTACCPPVKHEQRATEMVYKPITLADAITEVQHSISEARQSKEKMGEILGKVTITLEIGATKTEGATEGAEYKVGVAIPVIGAEFGTANSNSTTQTDARTSKNTITLEFENPLLAGTDTVLGYVVANNKFKEMKALLREIETGEWLLIVK